MWISVKDKLPEYGVYVLTFDGDYDIDYWGYHFRDANDNRYDSFYSETVTHWMPLHEPPII